MLSSRVWKALPTPRGMKIAWLGSSSAVNTAPKVGAFAQVHPGAEDPPGGHRDELVPRLGMDAAGGAGLLVERDVVLHRPEVRQPEGHHLLPLPVLLEPAAVVAVDGQVVEDDAGNGGFVAVSFFENSIDMAYWPCSLYLASVAAFCGRHQSSLSRYQAMVSSMPASKLENCGFPAELVAQLGGVDGVAQVVAGPVHHVVVGVRGLAHVLEDQLDDVLVVLLAVGADQVGLADACPCR